jgi:tRNA (guanine-N7-)-methyltransferase
VARVRHRKSINPFRLQLQIERPDWSSILDPLKPVEVDCGFGRGEFILEMARRHPDVEYVGLEIRTYLIEKVQALLQEEPLPNVHVFLANVKEHLSVLFEPGMLRRVYVHFPDPWTKRKKHRKRRMVDAHLVAALHQLLEPEGQVHLMTDKEVVGLEMRHLFEAHGGYENACGAGQFCRESTTDLPTREEQYYIARGDPVYRLKFVKT